MLVLQGVSPLIQGCILLWVVRNGAAGDERGRLLSEDRIVRLARSERQCDSLPRPFKYDIDIKDLDTRFKAMQRKLHPDFFHGKPKVALAPVALAHVTQREQELSDELSKAVNRCYRTLKDPNLRGLYMARAAVCLSPDVSCSLE